MKGKLIKMTGIYTLIEDNKMIASDDVDFQGDYQVGKLSKQNCDEIFGAFEVEKLINESDTSHLSQYTSDSHELMFDEGFKIGFNKAIELNKDKLFTVADMENCWDASFDYYRNDSKDSGVSFEMYIQALQQPKEIEVEVVMDKIPADLAPGGWDVFPKLDENNCLILKKK
jgi:hypothetical protein